MKRLIYILAAIVIVAVIVLCIGVNEIGDKEPVAEAVATNGSEEKENFIESHVAENTSTQGNTTKETTTKETTTKEDVTQEDTTPEDTSSEEPTSREESTTKPNENNNDGTDYIYYQVRDDENNAVAFGDIEASEEQLKSIDELIKSYGKPVSFKAVSVDGSGGVSFNSQQTYFAASSIKAPYLLYCYKQMDNGDGTLTETMTYNSSYYKDGSGDMKNSANGTVYELSEIMRRVMWNSDNVGYNMCVSRWGRTGYNTFLESIGLSNLKLSSGSIWVYDVRAEDLVIAWKNIYDYFNSGAQHAEIFYDNCINVKWNVLGEGLPGLTIAQKYGIGYDVFCDTAIVYGKNQTYLLAIFTDSEANSKDKAFMNDLAKLINNIIDK